MKNLKIILSFVLLAFSLCLPFMLVGCGKEALQADIETLRMENEQIAQDKQILQAENELLQHKLNGEHLFEDRWHSDGVCHWRNCSVCDETTEVEEHDYEFVEFIDANANDGLFRCSICGFENRWSHDHECETVIENGVATTTCHICAKSESANLVEFEESVGGTYEIIADEYIADSCRIFCVAMPKSDVGYYFDHWEVGYKHHQKTSFDSSTGTMRDNNPYLMLDIGIYENRGYTTYSVKPIFTTVNPGFDEVEISFYDNTSNELLDKNIEFEYVFFTNSIGLKEISYYFHKNDDLLLQAVYVVDNNSHNVIADESSHKLPYFGTKLLEEENFYTSDEVVFKFDIIGNKKLIKIDQVGNYNDEKYILADVGETININVGLIKDYLYGKHVESWQDEQGNVLSTEHEFEYVVEDDAIIYLFVQNEDLTTDIDGHKFYFMYGKDNNLILTGFSCEQYDYVTIPEQANGLPVTEIGILNTRGKAGELIIPDSIIKIHPQAFKYINEGYNQLKITFTSNRTDLCASDFAGCNSNIRLNFSEETLAAIVRNELHKIVSNDVELNVIFANEMPENTLGYYTNGTKNITIIKLPENGVWTRNILIVLVHELRHFYQEIAIGNVDGLGLDDLIVKPTENQIGSWKYLEYTSSTENYDKYYFNAREIDAREYANEIMLFDIVE